MGHQVSPQFKKCWFVYGVSGSYLRRVAILMSLQTVLALLPVAAQEPDPRDHSREALVSFDIPAQPLADALYAYSSVTGIEMLVPADRLSGRSSSGVVGLVRSDDALRLLLKGSGLVPRTAGVNAFTLDHLVPGPTERIPVPRYPRYSTAIQAAVTRVLCQLQETRPGGYRIAVRLWVGASGAVTRVGLLGSTGDARRDAILSNLFMRVNVGLPPPRKVPQPTTVLILPRQEARGCRVGLLRGQGP